MPRRPLLAFLAFTAVFAALAGFVFWGTWSLDAVPVMPDCPWTHPADAAARWFNGFLAEGKFIPGDVLSFVGSPYFWQELKFVLALYCSALGVAYYCRGRGLSPVAGYGAGLLLAFSGYWMTLFSAGHYGWFQWMTYGVFAFGLVDRAIARNRPRHWLLLGAVVAWAGFNQQDLWLLFSIFTTAYFLFRAIAARKFPWKGALAALAAFVVIGLPNLKGLLGGSILKDRESQIQQSAGAEAAAKGEDGAKAAAKPDDEARWRFVTNWSMPPEDTAEFVVPGVHGDTSCPLTLSVGLTRGSGVKPYTGRLGRPMDAPSGNYRQHSLYLGFVFCLLALLGAASAFRTQGENRREILFFAAAALVFYLLSLGRFFAPCYRLVFALPLGDMIRCPVKWHHLTELSLAVLAGYGLDNLMTLLKRHGKAAGIVAAVAAIVGAADLARVDRRFLAPVDVTEARRTNASAQFTVLRRDQFQNPQIAEMVRQKRIVSVANYLGNPDAYLVTVLERQAPFKPRPLSLPNLLLGLVSLAATLGIPLYSLKDYRHEA